MLQEWFKKFAKVCCWTTMKLPWMQSAKELTTNSLKPLFNHTEWVLHTWVIFSMTFVDSYWRPVGIAPTQVFSLLHKLCYGSPTSNSSLNHSLKVTQWNFIMHVSKQTYEISTRNIECIKYSNECVFLGLHYPVRENGVMVVSWSPVDVELFEGHKGWNRQEMEKSQHKFSSSIWYWCLKCIYSMIIFDMEQ